MRHYALLLSVAAAVNMGFVSIVFQIVTKNRGSPTVKFRSQYEMFTACCELFNLSVKLIHTYIHTCLFKLIYNYINLKGRV